ncbi:hypothetical protein KCU93_g4914, partial [Aureobasidium melanogenum]
MTESFYAQITAFLNRDDFYLSLCKLHPQSTPGPIYPKKYPVSEFQARLVATKPDNPNYPDGTGLISIVQFAMMAKSRSKMTCSQYI